MEISRKKFGVIDSLRQFEDPRQWSNIVLDSIISLLPPYDSVLNVSGWNDGDKQGGLYQNYFRQATSYQISHYKGDVERSGVGGPELDLSDTNVNHSRAFDIVFSHTVLEHVPDPTLAFEHIAALSKKFIITVVPMVQSFHFSPGNYGDYWRFMPHSLEVLHQNNGFRLIFLDFGPRYSFSKYIISVGERIVDPSKSTNLDHSLGFTDLMGIAGNFSRREMIMNLLFRAIKVFT